VAGVENVKKRGGGREDQSDDDHGGGGVDGGVENRGKKSTKNLFQLYIDID